MPTFLLSKCAAYTELSIDTASGEITPEKLGVLADIGQKYGLYTKITGGQRIDLFGARVDQLPDIGEGVVEGEVDDLLASLGF